MKNCNLTILCLLLMNLISLEAQITSRIVPTISVKDGLSQNSILKLEQDSLGFLWIGTEAGLSRWNGNNIVNYPNTNNDSIPGGFIRSLHSDHNGILWVIPGDGKLYYRNNANDIFRQSQIDIKVLNSNVLFITSNENNNTLIFITEDNKVYSWNYSNSRINLIANFRHKNIKTIHWYNDDLLLGSDRGWLYITSENKIIPKENIEWLDNSESPIYDIEEIENTIYAARNSWGITVHNLNIPKYKNIAIESTILVKDYHNQLLSTKNGKDISVIYNLKDIKHTVISKPNLLEVSDFYLLKTGQVVLGSTSSGLWMIDPFKPTFTSWTHNMPFSKDIMSIVEDENRDLWLATFNGGIIRFNEDNNTIHSYQLDKNNIYSDNIKFLTVDSSNRIWAASNDHGFFKYNAEKDIFEPHVTNGIKNITFANLKINHILEKQENILLISSEKGLYEYNILTKTANLIFKSFVWASLIDKDGVIWICTDNGLYKKSQADFEEIGIYRDRVWFITQTDNGDIITGTPKGLSIISKNGKSYQYKNLEKHTENKPVYSVMVDKLNFYWITTNSGIIRWDRSIDSLSIYTTNDGLLSNEFNLYSSTELLNGNLILGSLKGFNEINPENIFSNPFQPEIIIDNLQKISYSDQSLETDIRREQSLDDVILKPTENILRVGIQPIDYHNFNNIQIKYQLIGLSDSWFDISKENHIMFVNLSPKKYKLNIIATNITDISSSVKTIEIEVKPYFIETLLFKMLIIMIISIIIFIIILYVHKMRREIILRRGAELKYSKLNSDLEMVVNKRTNELKLSNEKMIQQEKMSSLGQLVAGVAHEINTPLGVAILSNSFIYDNIKEVSKKYKTKTLTAKYLENSIDEIEQVSEHLTYNLKRAADLIKNFKQVAVDKNIDSKTTFDISISIESLLHSLHSVLKQNKIIISFDIEQNLQINSFPSEISQIITNLIMNSIYHGYGVNFDKDIKNIKLNVKQDKSNCIITYHDNGCGIPDEYINKIFDPFFTTNRSKGGTGLGLNIVYNIIKEKLDGNIDVSSEVNKYTEFIISIPLNL